MPIYEYECGDCGHRLEVLQRITDDRLTTCPSCSQEALKKLVSPVGFQLKGTGWYETDFKNKGKPEAKKDKDGEKSDSSSKDSSSAKSDGSAKSGSDNKSSSGKSEAKSAS